MGRPLIDVTGQRFGRLTVTSRSDRTGNTFWHCVCDCGEVAEIAGGMLRSGKAKSCGCYRKEASAEQCRSRFRHGLMKTPTYRSWIAMRYRCLKPASKDFPHYGGRGITICERWSDFMVFLSDMGERPAGTTLDRIDVNGNYEPSNCRWADIATQNRNQRNDAAHKARMKAAAARRVMDPVWKANHAEGQRRRWARVRAQS